MRTRPLAASLRGAGRHIGEYPAGQPAQKAAAAGWNLARRQAGEALAPLFGSS